MSNISIANEGTILEKTDLNFENQAVLNPACIQDENGLIHMFYRAVENGNRSSIGYCQLDKTKVLHRQKQPVLVPEHDFEIAGIEDPRIVKLDGVYYLVYIAFDGRNARIAYATSTKLPNFEKKGLISPQLTYKEVVDICKNHQESLVHAFYKKHYANTKDVENMLLYEKDALIFPRKISGKFAMVHRVFPSVQIVYFDEFSELTEEFWRNYFREMEDHTIIRPKYWYESRHVGGGCPPIETKDGWLFIYHAVEENKQGKIYHAAAALLDLHNPTRVIGQLEYPLFSPQEEWEKEGDVNNVVFPTAAVPDGDRLYIYYGAAGRCIASRSLDLNELLEALKSSASDTLSDR